MKPNPQARIHTHQLPCHICGTKTRRLRSLTHLHGPPDDLNDSVPICLNCGYDWTFAVNLANRTRQRRK